MLYLIVALTLLMLIFSVIKGLFVGYALIASFLLFCAFGSHLGFSTQAIYQMAIQGAKKALIVLRIFILIGAITGVWMSSGTVPAIVYYGLSYLSPHWFILFAFLIASAVSMLLGTSFGTIGTVGVALMLMAKSGGVDLSMTAGAVMAGAYFGDRCSPMSSSANLVAHLTHTELYDNIKNMFQTAWVPLAIAILGYGGLSLLQPLKTEGSQLPTLLQSSYAISWVVLIPAAIVLVLALFKIKVRTAMVFSIGSAVIIAALVQNQSLVSIFKALCFGYYLPAQHPLSHIISGGGIISMWKAAVVVTTSSALAGVFEGTQMLSAFEKSLQNAKGRFSVLSHCTLVSMLNSAIGCNQSIAIILTEQLMRQTYELNQQSKRQLAVDIENTGVVIAALTPWNIAAFVPTSTMGVDPYSYLPYAIYLYAIPLWALLWAFITERHQKNKISY